MTLLNRYVILILTASFFAMLGASLLQRFTHPSLTITRQGDLPVEENSAGASIGRLMEAVAKDPGNREILLNLVESLMAVGQWASAQNFAQKALALDEPGREDERALYLLAVAHHNQDRHAEAAELLEKLLKKKENASARYSLGILYLHYLHEPHTGIEHLEKGLQVPGISTALEKTIRDELARARATLSSPSPESEQ